MRGDIGLTGLILLSLFAAAPAAATRVEFVWQATGTNSITVAPGEQVVLEARVIAEGDRHYGIGVSALAPIDLLLATGYEVCPNGCGTLAPVGLDNVTLNNASDRAGAGKPYRPVDGLSGSFFAVSLASTSIDYVLFELTFQVQGVGSGQVLPYYRAGLGGIADVDLGFLLPPVDGADFSSGITLNVIPEPTTGTLLGVGLLGVALGRRKHARPAAARER